MYINKIYSLKISYHYIYIGQLDNLEYELYQRWFGLLQKTATPLSAIVYVDTVPNQCSERISLRNRDGEQGILIFMISL